MELQLQKYIMDKPKLYEHLKQNSAWIKILNRNPLAIKEFEEKMKEQYKVDEVLDNIDLITTFLNAMK